MNDVRRRKDIAIRRAIARHLANQPLGDEDPSDEDLALVLFIATYAVQHGYTPSYREIAKTRGVSCSTVHYRIGRLVKAGLLRHEPGTRRALEVVR